MKISKKYAERFYNTALKIIEDEYTGDRVTYLSELENAGKKIFGDKFKGVYAADTIPTLDERQPYIIANLDNSDESGSHWVSIVHAGKGKCIFYDSFGRRSTKILKGLGKYTSCKIVDTENDKEQHPLEFNCGARCIAFICVCHFLGTDAGLLI